VPTADSCAHAKSAAPAATTGPTTAPPEVVEWLARQRGYIIGEWAERLAVLSPSYRKRPMQELLGTAREAFDSNLEAMATGDLTRIEHFIAYITQKRLNAGFPLSDVQKAFELFRSITIELLLRPEDQHLLPLCLPSLNACLSHTIHRFSDHFQHMHELSIRQHAENLERTVRQRTAELAESERRYKTLVNEINDGYFVIQKERIAFANRTFCRMHGAELEEVLGQPFLDFVHPEDRRAVSLAYHDALAGRSAPQQLEYRRLGCPPKRAATEIKARVVDLGQGPVTIGICRDISRRVAMEKKVREHERLAYVGHLTASLSHEIRNPLSAIKMNLQILVRRLELTGYDRRRLEISAREVERLEGILHQLLDTARPLNLRRAPVDLAALVESCLELLEPKAADKGVTIIRRQAVGLPLVNGDAGRLEQALINLLLNALEAVERGGRIVVWSRRPPRSPHLVELGVRDNGAGVAPEQLPHLFTPFFTSKARGTGLGLSNVKRIVEAHGGEVRVKSSPGRGAAFILRLPCR